MLRRLRGRLMRVLWVSSLAMSVVAALDTGLKGMPGNR
jgi:hypothetical protein